MYILGLGGSLHDFSACLVKDKEIIVAIEEERITRVKHAIDKDALEKALENRQVWKFIQTIPKDMLNKSINYCLEYAGISIDDLDIVVTTDSILYLNSVKSFSHLIIINHHMAHAASAYYPSGFEEAAILVVDGRGSEVMYGGQLGYESVTLAYGNGRKIKILEKVLDHSIGHFYETAVLALGFGILEDGKVMGLSSYGTNKYMKSIQKYYQIEKNRVIFGDGLDELKVFIENELGNKAELQLFQAKADIAYAIQRHVESMMCFYTERLKKITGCENLCIAGGVALNSVANGVVYEKSGFKNIFVQPAAGDNGLSIGSALYVANYINQK